MCMCVPLCVFVCVRQRAPTVCVCESVCVCVIERSPFVSGRKSSTGSATACCSTTSVHMTQANTNSDVFISRASGLKQSRDQLRAPPEVTCDGFPRCRARAFLPTTCVCL